jgi:hypothetical protein
MYIPVTINIPALKEDLAIIDPQLLGHEPG